MAKTILRVLFLALVALLIPPLMASGISNSGAATQPATDAAQPPASDSTAQPASQDTAQAPAKKEKKEKKVENRAHNLFSPADNPVNPMPSLWGAPGLWDLVGAGGLPRGSFGGGAFMNRINRNPGYLTVTTIGASGFVSLARRFSLDVQMNINRRILMRRADQTSFGQATLASLFKGGCPQPNCSPLNIFPTTLYPGTILPLLRDPHTGVISNTAGFSNQFPWASQLSQNGFGEVVVGGRFTIKDFNDDGSGIAVGVRPHVSIPTRYSAANLMANGIQTGEIEYGADLLVEGHAGHAAGIYFNGGYTHTTNPEQYSKDLFSLYDYAPIKIGLNIPRTSRLQAILEYAATFVAGSGTRDQGLGTWTEGTAGFRGYLAPWLSLSAGYRHTLNHTQYGGDKNGFVVQFAASYVPVEKVAAPVPPTVTCSAEPTTVRPGQEVRLTANANSTAGYTLTYAWTTTGGRVEGTGPSARLDTTGLAPGTYTVTVRVDDGHGGFADCTSNVTVQAPPPPPAPKPPTVTCSVDKSSIAPGEVVTVRANASSPDNRPLNYDWSVTGGRVTGTGPTVRWDTTGASAGTYTATVRVTDDRGLSADCSSTITVQAPPPPPRAAKLNECSFKVQSPRVDNKCKAVLDDVALRLQNEPDSRAAVVGSKTAKERAKNIAVQRASNVKAYLVREKGIDAGRVEVRTSPEDTGKVEVWLVPRGASMSDVPGASAQEMMPPAAKARKTTHRATKATKKGAAKTTP